MAMNKPGRPPIDPTDASVVVSLTIPARAFDEYYRRAQLARVSVPEVIRRTLKARAGRVTETSDPTRD
jgi:hypothetical protein